MINQKCYHQSIQYYNEFEDEETGEIIEEDFEVCRDCNMVIFNGEEIGLSK